jgi:hypothetical protein
MPPSKPSPRKPGGQIGNQNALKHGFYSRYLQRTELFNARRRLSGNLAEEQTLLRILIHRTLSMASECQDPAFQLSLLTAIQKAIHTLARLDLIQYRPNPAADDVHRLLEQARQALTPENLRGRWVWLPEPPTTQPVPATDPEGNPYTPPPSLPSASNLFTGQALADPSCPPDPSSPPETHDPSPSPESPHHDQ